MRLGCAAYSYRDLLSAGEMSLETFVDRCAELGLDGVELTSYYFRSTDRAYLNQLKLHCARKGMHILGTAVGSNFCHAEEEKRREQVKMTHEWIEHSVILGAPCIRVFAGYVPEGHTADEAFGWTVDCLKECVEHGERAGVAIALENHGGITSTAAQVERLVSAIESPWFGLNLDFGNFREDPYAEFARVAPRAITTHAKVCSRFGERTGLVDYRRVRAIMEEAGYRGYLSIEYEEKEPPEPGVPLFVETLKQALE